MYELFLKYLAWCGGCIGLRNRDKCSFAFICAHVENMKERGEISNSEDLLGADTLRNRSKALLYSGGGHCPPIVASSSTDICFIGPSSTE